MTTGFTRSKYTADATAYGGRRIKNSRGDYVNNRTHDNKAHRYSKKKKKKRKKKEEKTHASCSALQIIKRFCGLTRVCSFIRAYNICTRKE